MAIDDIHLLARRRPSGERAWGLWAASALMDRSLNESSLNLDQLSEDTLEFAGIMVWTVGWIAAVHDTNRGVGSA